MARPTDNTIGNSPEALRSNKNRRQGPLVEQRERNRYNELAHAGLAIEQQAQNSDESRRTWAEAFPVKPPEADGALGKVA